MTIRSTHVFSILVTLVTALLSGCSSEPSSSDIKTLVDRDIKPALEMQAQLMGNAISAFSGNKAPSSKTTLTDVRKLGCKSDGDHAYACDVELVMQTADGEKSRVLPLRLVKGGSGWLLAQ
jgi:hypothetical protein